MAAQKSLRRKTEALLGPAPECKFKGIVLENDMRFKNHAMVVQSRSAAHGYDTDEDGRDWKEHGRLFSDEGRRSLHTASKMSKLRILDRTVFIRLGWGLKPLVRLSRLEGCDQDFI